MLTDTASLRVSSCWVCGNWQEHRFVFNGGATATANAAATAAAATTATAAAAGSGGSAGSGSSGGSWRPGVPYQTQQTHQARQNTSFFEDDEVEVNHKGKGEWYRATIALVRPDGTW